MGVMPVVVVPGARPPGKSTLVRALTEDMAVLGGASSATPDRDRYLYQTLDSPAVIGRAVQDPDAFVRQAECLVIDEVQRHPGILTAIKTAVDQDRPRR